MRDLASNTYARAGAALTVVLASVAFVAGPAGATPSPTETGFSEMESEVGTIAPLFFGLAVLLIAIGLGYRWVRKGAKAG